MGIFKTVQYLLLLSLSFPPSPSLWLPLSVCLSRTIAKWGRAHPRMGYQKMENITTTVNWRRSGPRTPGTLLSRIHSSTQQEDPISLFDSLGVSFPKKFFPPRAPVGLCGVPTVYPLFLSIRLSLSFWMTPSKRLSKETYYIGFFLRNTLYSLSLSRSLALSVLLKLGSGRGEESSDTFNGAGTSLLGPEHCHFPGVCVCVCGYVCACLCVVCFYLPAERASTRERERERSRASEREILQSISLERE